MMCINLEFQEQEEIERKFRKAGDKFTDITGKGGFNKLTVSISELFKIKTILGEGWNGRQQI